MILVKNLGMYNVYTSNYTYINTYIHTKFQIHIYNTMLLGYYYYDIARETRYM